MGPDRPGLFVREVDYTFEESQAKLNSKILHSSKAF